MGLDFSALESIKYIPLSSSYDKPIEEAEPLKQEASGQKNIIRGLKGYESIKTEKTADKKQIIIKSLLQGESVERVLLKAVKLLGKENFYNEVKSALIALYGAEPIKGLKLSSEAERLTESLIWLKEAYDREKDKDNRKIIKKAIEEREKLLNSCQN